MKQKYLPIIKKLRQERYSYREIGEKLGISKQRVHQVFRNYNTSPYKNDKFKEIVLKYVGNSCKECGSKENLEIHHIDGNRNNNKFNNLERLCRKCHRKKEIIIYYNGKETERNRGKYKGCKVCGEKIWVVPCQKNLNKEFCSRKCLGIYSRKEYQHGTIQMYRRRKCHCVLCKKANTDYFKKYNN